MYNSPFTIVGTNKVRHYKLRYDYFTMALACGEWRRENGIRQSRIAQDLDVSSVCISNYECGKNNSATIFMWYLEHGFTLSWYERFLNGMGDILVYYGEKKLR